MPRDHTGTPGTDAKKDWPAVLDRYGVQYLILDKKGDSDLLREFRTEPQWLIEVEGRESVLLARAGMRQEAPPSAGLPY